MNDPAARPPLYHAGQAVYQPRLGLRGVVLALDPAGTPAVWSAKDNAWMYTLRMRDGLFETMRFAERDLLPDSRGEEDSNG